MNKENDKEQAQSKLIKTTKTKIRKLKDNLKGNRYKISNTCKINKHGNFLVPLPFTNQYSHRS